MLYLELWFVVLKLQGRTGFPFIDAVMTQLRKEGWIHHLGRHAVACFLTRGDLWVSWEEGMKVFEEYLLDADWSLNAGNWMWLSASAFFHQYFRVYSPIAFGKKTDKNGDFIRLVCALRLTLVLLNPDIPCLCKQCRSWSVGLSQLIWICTVCH